MQQIKIKANALAHLGCAIDHEDLTDTVLAGLGEEYKLVIDSIHARDTLISFAELHEKLLNRELDISSSQQSRTLFPVTAHHAQNRNRNWNPSNNNNQTQPTRPNQEQRQSHRYLGKCQACGTQGHNVKRCPLFRLLSQLP